MDDRGILAEVVIGLADLLGCKLDADRLQRLDFLGLFGLGVLPFEGDVNSLDVVGGNFTFGYGVDLIDNRCCGDRSHDKLGTLRQRALGSGHVDGHAVAVLRREGDGRVLDLFVLLLLVGVLVVSLVVGLVLAVGLFLILVVGVDVGFVAFVS